MWSCGVALIFRPHSIHLKLAVREKELNMPPTVEWFLPMKTSRLKCLFKHNRSRELNFMKTWIFSTIELIVNLYDVLSDKFATRLYKLCVLRHIILLFTYNNYITDILIKR